MFEIYIPIITAQLADPFRIGLLAALIYTTIRNAAATGWLVPLAAGIVFVAVIIATTLPKAGETLTVTTLTGIASNTVITAIMLAVLYLYQRFSK
jgi:hypothetical protein